MHKTPGQDNTKILSCVREELLSCVREKLLSCVRENLKLCVRKRLSCVRKNSWCSFAI